MTDLLRDSLAWLEHCGIEYMVVGSVASSLYGQARATQDVDVVVELTPEQLRRLAAELPESRYYLSLEAAQQALAHTGQFNLIDTLTGGKVDLILRKARPFSRSEFSRRRKVSSPIGEIVVASAEDVVLAKLEWNRISPSERQRRDVASILGVQAANLDWQYLEQWAKKLGVWEDLTELRT